MISDASIAPNKILSAGEGRIGNHPPTGTSGNAREFIQAGVEAMSPRKEAASSVPLNPAARRSNGASGHFTSPRKVWARRPVIEHFSTLPVALYVRTSQVE